MLMKSSPWGTPRVTDGWNGIKRNRETLPRRRDADSQLENFVVLKRAFACLFRGQQFMTQAHGEKSNH